MITNHVFNFEENFILLMRALSFFYYLEGIHIGNFEVHVCVVLVSSKFFFLFVL